MTIHKTVLLEETIEALKLEPGMVVVDATLGGGGHAKQVLKKIGKSGKLIAFDQDQDAISRFEKFIEVGSDEKCGKNIFLFHDNFSLLKDRLTSIGINSVDAILADLGISSDQLEDIERGISFQKDAPLDMRMDLSQGITAAEVVNSYDEDDLIRILKEYGDESYARSIVRSILAEREKKPFSRTSELVGVIERSVPGQYKRKKIHPATKTFQAIRVVVNDVRTREAGQDPATRTFQALRIEVNRELKSLEAFLSQATQILKPGGRLAIITFHSGEDAMVKHAFRENARGCICPPEFPGCRGGKKPVVKLITSKPVSPGEDEISSNPRSRSAKLRVIEKV